MKKIALSIMLLTIVSVACVVAQEKDYDVDGRFILVENPEQLFEEKEDCLEIAEFYIQNFKEEDSSKPVHLSVNQLEGVVQFGIASGSERFYMQRRCYIHLAKENYKHTFYEAILEMGVEAIIVNDEVMTPSSFYNYLLKL